MKAVKSSVGRSVPHNPTALVASSISAASSGSSGSMEPRQLQRGSYHTRALTRCQGGEYFCFLTGVTQRTEKLSKSSIWSLFKRLIKSKYMKKISFLCSITIVSPEILFSSFFPEAVRMTLTFISHYLLYTSSFPMLLLH